MSQQLNCWLWDAGVRTAGCRDSILSACSVLNSPDWQPVSRQKPQELAVGCWWRQLACMGPGERQLRTAVYSPRSAGPEDTERSGALSAMRAHCSSPGKGCYQIQKQQGKATRAPRARDLGSWVLDISVPHPPCCFLKSTFETVMS